MINSQTGLFNSTSEDRIEVLSLQITKASYTELLEDAIVTAKHGLSKTMCFANVHMLVECRRNPIYAGIVNQADWVAPGGMPLIWAIKAQYGLHQDRIDGLDLLPDLLNRAAEEHLPVFFYGSTFEVLELTRLACQKRFPTLRIAGMFSPPFRPLTPKEEDDIVQTIGTSGARIVIVALGCPKQEQFIARVRGRIPATLIAVGAALPVLAGVKSRAPIWMQKAGLEWLYRLQQEPKRLFRRYFQTNSLFIYYLLQARFKKQKS